VDDRPVAGFNLAAVVDGEGLCLHFDGELRPVPMGPGLHVVSTDRDLDDPTMPERRVVEAWAADAGRPPSEAELTRLLATHDGDRPICKHGDRFGTVSSTIYIESSPPRLLHAEGPPCRTPFLEAQPP
jgi:hypothetical protein